MLSTHGSAWWIAFGVLLMAPIAWAQEKPGEKSEGWQKPEGYKPLPRPSELIPPPEAPPDEAVSGSFRLRLSYRRGFLNGSDIGKSEGFFLGERPKADEAFRDSRGVGVDLSWWFVPLAALQFSFSIERFQGRTMTTPVDRVRFDDLRLLKFSVGPRLNLPFGMDRRSWVQPGAILKMSGVTPYLRIGFGWALSSGVDVHLQNGQEVKYWSQSVSFHFILAIGFEYQADRLGIFCEFGIDTFGPLQGAREPEAKDWEGLEAPISFGLSWRFG